MKKISILIFVLLPFLLNAQLISIKGRVTDESDKKLAFVSVFTKDSKFSVYTNVSGDYLIEIPTTYKKLYFSQQEGDPLAIEIPYSEKNLTLNVKLGASNQIEVVVVNAEKVNSTGIISIDSKISDILPSINEGIESLVKTELGVAGSRNELSSKYSVRGGSFDENLVYVNGIEIYRPQLVRSGQQEGLSFINPKLVSDARFSSGGFEARYGGKMSSVLDITYKQARKKEFTGSVSFLGASVHYQDISKNKKLSHISGFRYKTTGYMLKTLETKGDYNPKFMDFQTFWTYYIDNKFSINLLANISDNSFHFKPSSGTTNFGSIQSIKSLYVSYAGQETDRFLSYTEAISFNYHPHKDLNFTITFSGLQASEAETFDIIGFYSLNELNKDISSETAGDSILNLGNGAFMRHARNYLDILNFSSMLTGYYKNESHYFNWGIIYKNEVIKDKIDEWNLKDSASFSLPMNPNSLEVSENIKGRNRIENDKITAYIQDKINFETYGFQYELVGGLRANYTTLSEELLFSPRIAVAAKSYNKNKHVFRFSSGIFHQPVFYKEIKNFDGKIVDNKSAQKSIHFVLGHNFRFNALGRKMKFFTEIYYKDLQNIIPFEMDNVRVRYFADTRTSGYVAGVDTKLMGDFVPGIDSWLSISVLKTEENVNTVSLSGNDTSFYIPRPTDQRFSANLFVQDYVPGYKKFKAHLNLVYGSAFRFGYPKDIAYKAVFKSSPYSRVDVGASMVLVQEGVRNSNRYLKYFKSIWLTVEVFNMLAIKNTISYRWIHVVPNTSIAANNVNDNFPVPVNLTGRRFNLKLTIKI